MQEVTDSSSVVPTIEPCVSCRRFRPNAPICGVSVFFRHRSDKLRGAPSFGWRAAHFAYSRFSCAVFRQLFPSRSASLMYFLVLQNAHNRRIPSDGFGQLWTALPLSTEKEPIYVAPMPYRVLRKTADQDFFAGSPNNERRQAHSSCVSCFLSTAKTPAERNVR